MKQMTIISGKGGTGKTTITAAFASLAKDIVLADCDVDAADLQLLLSPEIQNQEDYFGTRKAVKISDCSICGKCVEVCHFNAISEKIDINEAKCEGCGACEYICPEDAIEMSESRTGVVYQSETRSGPMIHGELDIGEEASGKMVTQIREKARSVAGEESLVLVDGSPGVGCPVIASIKGVDYVLIVSEPTVSGIHDLERVLDVAEHFGVSSSVCINKYDINEDKTSEIEKICQKRGFPVLGKLPYDDVATKAMINQQTLMEYSNSDLSQKVEKIWNKIESSLSE